MTNLKAIYKQIFQEKFHFNYLYVFLSLSKILLYVLLVLLPEGKKTYNLLNINYTVLLMYEHACSYSSLSRFLIHIT